MRIDAVGHKELGVFGPAIAALGQPDFLFAQRLPVGLGSVLLMWCAVTNVAVQDDQRGPAFGLTKSLECPLDLIHVIGVADAQHVPLVSKEARRHILGEGDIGVAFDGDVVVVENPAEVVEAQVARE